MTFAAIFMPDEKVRPYQASTESQTEEESQPLNPSPQNPDPTPNENSDKNPASATSPEAPSKKEDFGWATLAKVFKFIAIPQVFRPILIIFIFQITPSSGSAMFYFYTNELHFSPTFMGKLTVVCSAAGIFGIWLYNKYLKNVAFKRIFVWSVIVSTILGLS